MVTKPLEQSVGEKIQGTNYIYNDQDAQRRLTGYGTRGRIMLFGCTASRALAYEIADYLHTHYKLDIKPGEYTRTVFSNENIFIQLNESVRGQDIYVIQTMSSPIHDNFMEMLIMIDTLKRDSAGRISVVVPYLSYSRSDKKDQPRVGIAARLVANIIEVAGADRYMTVDLHAGQIQGFYNIPGDALSAFYLLSDYVLDKKIPDLVVVAADLGFAKKARDWANKLDAQLAIIEKRRVDNAERPKALAIIGEVRGKNVLLVDDEVLTGGSVVNDVNLLREEGARDIYLAFTHGLLAGEAVSKLAALDLKEIIFTNTIPLPEEKRLPNMKILSIAPMIGEVILRTHLGESVGKLFNE